MRRTVFTSNLSVAEIAERLGDRIASRICGMGVVHHLDGCDRRLSPAS
jgi:DNA replication protein DnaC